MGINNKYSQYNILNLQLSFDYLLFQYNYSKHDKKFFYYPVQLDFVYLCFLSYMFCFNVRCVMMHRFVVESFPDSSFFSVLEPSASAEATT